MQDDLKKALLASLQDLDPNNPWVKDPTGKHTNVIALLDWPEESDESDSESTSKPVSESAEQSVGSAEQEASHSVEESDSSEATPSGMVFIVFVIKPQH